MMSRTASRAPTTASTLILEMRRRAGLTQAGLARRAGMPRSVVNAYERGAREPGVDALARLASAAGLELRVRPAVRHLDAARAGRLLSQVLDLAEALPHGRRRGLTPSPFTPAVSPAA
jgi:transcriptional regulator with XRE-family HTH domain